jgi:hypothetical protein
VFFFFLIESSKVRCQPAIGHLEIVLEKSPKTDYNPYSHQQDTDQRLLSSIYHNIPSNFIQSDLNGIQVQSSSQERLDSSPLNVPSWSTHGNLVGQRTSDDLDGPVDNQKSKPVYQIEFEIIKDDQSGENNQKQLNSYASIDNFEENGSNFYSEDFMNNQLASTKVSQPKLTNNKINKDIINLNGNENKTNGSSWSANSISTIPSTPSIPSTQLYINQTKKHVDPDLNNSTTRKIDLETNLSLNNRTASKFISKIKNFSDKIVQKAPTEKPVEDILKGDSSHLPTPTSTHTPSKISSDSLKDKKPKSFFKSESFDDLYDMDVLPSHHAILNRKFKQHFVEKRVHTEQQGAKGRLEPLYFFLFSCAIFFKK